MDIEPSHNEYKYSKAYVESMYGFIGMIIAIPSEGCCVCADIIGGCAVLVNNKEIICVDVSQLESTDCHYYTSPFIWGDIVKTKNGTYIEGVVMRLVYHFNDKEFKYFIADEKGKIRKRRYNPTDLELMERTLNIAVDKIQDNDNP
ncbi:MAG: hypothetical protein E6767_02365 [Dysgonomonas sp.]|nr:hypothetical protein [Dysgonomonas sp.]